LRRVYMDNNSTTAVHPDVLEEMLPYFSSKFGNPSSIHQAGQEAKAALDKARERVAGLIGASAEEIFFTGGGTEADNLAIVGYALANASRGKHIITSAIEHKAVLEPCGFLEKSGFRVTRVGVDGNGTVRFDEIEEAVSDDTILISVMMANNEVGTIQPFEEIGRLARKRGIAFHTDAVQAGGKLEIDVGKTGASLLVLSAHKMYGPKGIGALYVKRGVRLDPIIRGGGHEKGRRSGTENVPAIVGFGKAAEIMAREQKSGMEKLRRLRDSLEKGILDKVADVRINGAEAPRVPNTSNVSFESVEGESLVLSLDLEGIEVSTGSACSSGAEGPSHVLSAMGIPPFVAQGSLRFSLGLDNTEDDVARVLEILPGIVERLRSMSPMARKGGE